MPNPDSWFALSPRGRLLGWLAAVLCSLALLGWLVVMPQHTRLQQLHDNQAVREASRTAQWRTLRALAVPEGAQALAKARAFSPLGLQSQAQQLVRWQPGAGGGEVELETRWAAALTTFTQLAQCDMLIPSFSLTAGEGGLRFLLQLEQDDDR